LLDALEAFRRRFLPGTDPGLVPRFRAAAPASLSSRAARLFEQESLYHPGQKAPLGQRARIRLALAGSPWRFLRFGLGKLAWHALVGTRQKLSARHFRIDHAPLRHPG